MQFIDLIDSLTNRLQQPLPGADAQYLMAPQHRYKGETPERAVRAAVVLLLYPKEGTIYIPFIKRTEEKGPHSKQISFPGGRFDASDRSLLHTAIRELHEETGCNITPNNIIGQLTELYIPVSNTLVFPFVGYTDKIIDWQPEPLEVERILEFPINHFLNNTQIKVEQWNLMGKDTNVKFYNLDNEKVWGATAMILSEFVEIVKPLL